MTRDELKSFFIDKRESGAFSNSGWISLQQFQRVYIFLESLEKLGLINIIGGINYRVYKALVRTLGSYGTGVLEINYKFDLYQAGKLTELDLINHLIRDLGVPIQLTENYLKSLDPSPLVWRRHVDAIEVKEDITVEYYIKDELFEKNKNLIGVYIIFNANGSVGYVGQSKVCVLSRCFESVGERTVFDFSKIRILVVKNRRDIDKYEEFLIATLKPTHNMMLIDGDDCFNNTVNVEREITFGSYKKYFNRYGWRQFNNTRVSLPAFANGYLEGRYLYLGDNEQPLDLKESTDSNPILKNQSKLLLRARIYDPSLASELYKL